METLFRAGISPEIRKGKAEERKMTFVASTSARDSSGTVLNQEGWDLTRFNNNGIIGYQHNVYDSTDPNNIIGKGFAYIEEKDGRKQLLVDVEFEPKGMNPIADAVYEKLMFGTIKAVSVGFMPLGKGSFGKGEEAAGGKHETYYFSGQELLEVSVVNIPANPEALKRMVAIEREEASRVVEPSEDDKAREQAANALKMEKERTITLASVALALSNNL